MSNTFNLLAVGDVISTSGVAYLTANLWDIRKKYNIDCAVVNGENSAAGNGIDIKSAKAIISAGADVITSGNHVWHKKEIYTQLDESNNIIRPANYPDTNPGRGYTILNIAGYKILFINLLGTVYFEQGLESPFPCADRIFKREEGRFDFAVVDIHAEATSEKIALAKYIDGKYRAGAIFGTHTHVQTVDEQILKNGAGYITDLGMTGAADSILGLKNECVIQKFVTRMPVKFETEDENIELHGAVFCIDRDSFKCVESKRIKN